MDITKIERRINDTLAGEELELWEMLVHLDNVIDDINADMNTVFPVLSDFTIEAYPDRYPDYNFFPDEYVRKVLIIGAAYKYYTADEEGLDIAPKLGMEYEKNKFEMLRDHLQFVPEALKKDPKPLASIRQQEPETYHPNYVNFFNL